MAILAVLAGIAMFRDWRTAQLEAADQSRDVAEEVVGALIRYLESSEGQSGPLPLGIEPPRTLFVVDGTNRLRWPESVVWPPNPEPFNYEPEAGSRADWEKARQAMVRGEASEAVEAYDAILSGLTSNTPEQGPPGHGPNPKHTRWRRLALWERALALEKAGFTHSLLVEFQKVLGDFPWPGSGTPTESGVDAACLAALRILEKVAGDFSKLPEVWKNHSAELGDLFLSWPPSPYLETIAEALDDLAQHPEGRLLWVQSRRLSAKLKELDEIRYWHATALRELGNGKPWPAAFWLGRLPDGLVVPGWEPGTHLAYQVRTETNGSAAADPQQRSYRFAYHEYLRKIAEVAAGQLDRRGDFAVQIRVGGKQVDVGPGVKTNDRLVDPFEEPLASLRRTFGAGAELEVWTGYADPETFFLSQRRRQVWMAWVLGAAVVAAVISTWATRRALWRQHELNREKSNFVSSVSHELRAPLGSIRLLAEGLERGSLPDETSRKEYFRLIGQETRRLGALVENVLDFSRIEQGRKRYEKIPTNLEALVRDTVRLAERSAATRDLTLELVGLSMNHQGGCGVSPQKERCWRPNSQSRDGSATFLPIPGSSSEYPNRESLGPAMDPSGPEESDWEIEIDGRAVQQALVNLIDNATKHAPAGSRIVVEVEQPSDGGPERPESGVFRVSVSDQGPGIPKEDHERIFEPFFRRGSELRRETEGVGIGLSIVRHIMDAHGGRAEVASTPGKGATFTLIFPRPTRRNGGKARPGNPDGGTRSVVPPAPVPDPMERRPPSAGMSLSTQ